MLAICLTKDVFPLKMIILSIPFFSSILPHSYLPDPALPLSHHPGTPLFLSLALHNILWDPRPPLGLLTHCIEAQHQVTFQEMFLSSDLFQCFYFWKYHSFISHLFAWVWNIKLKVTPPVLKALFPCFLESNVMWSPVPILFCFLPPPQVVESYNGFLWSRFYPIYKGTQCTLRNTSFWIPLCSKTHVPRIF